jgi:hypothetical protein
LPGRSTCRFHTSSPAGAFEQDKDSLAKRETLALVRAYYRIRMGRVRKRLFEMVKALGEVSYRDVPSRRKRT